MGVTVISGSQILTEAFERLVMDWNFSDPITLVVDQPIGVALHLVPGLQGKYLVLTASRSPYYLSDLLEYRPSGIVQEPLGSQELRQVLQLLAQGGQLLPKLENDLPPKMRKVLRALASGMCSKRIAESMQLSAKRVYNIVSDLKFHLEAETHADLLLRYLGVSLKPMPCQGKNTRANREFFPSQPPEGLLPCQERR